MIRDVMVLEKQMKRLLALVGAVLIAFVIRSAAASDGAQEGAREGEGAYVVTGEDNRVVVYRSGELFLRTDTPLSALPKSDRKRLEQGIRVFSDTELKVLIEDLCS